MDPQQAAAPPILEIAKSESREAVRIMSSACRQLYHIGVVSMYHHGEVSVVCPLGLYALHRPAPALSAIFDWQCMCIAPAPGSDCLQIFAMHGQELMLALIYVGSIVPAGRISHRACHVLTLLQCFTVLNTIVGTLLR